MAGTQRVGGIITFQAGGFRLKAKGTATYNFGLPLREPVVGADGVHGYKEVPQVAFIELAVTDTPGLDVKGLLSMKDVTATLGLANGKTFMLHRAWHAGEGSLSTEEGELAARFESASEGEESLA